MKLGDGLEVLGLLSICAGIYLYLGLAASLIAVGLVLVYEGQCYGTTSIPRLRLPRLRRKKETPSEGA